jgi:hypothetical protein
MKQYGVVVNVALNYIFEAESPEEAIIQAENVELPENYIEDSFELVKVIDRVGEVAI